MNTIRIKVLYQALAALEVAQKALGRADYEDWKQVMEARYALDAEMRAMPDVEVKPYEVIA